MAMQDLLKADDIKKAMDTFKGVYPRCIYEQARNYNGRKAATVNTGLCVYD